MARCHQCGKDFPLYLLDAKPGTEKARDPTSPDWCRLECKRCYGPGWQPGPKEEEDKMTEYTRFPCPDAETQAKIDKLPKMNPTIKKMWVDALLFGNYKQSKKSLRSNNGFCCLGVLCDVYSKEAKRKKLYNHRLFSWRDYHGRSVFIDRDDMLPALMVSKAGLGYDDPCVIYRGKECTLSSLNDDGVSFKMIAGIIINQL